METIKSLFSDAEIALKKHSENVQFLQSIAALSAVVCSAEEMGELLISTSDGDYEKAKRNLDRLSRKSQQIFVEWAIATRLTYLENKGEMK